MNLIITITYSLFALYTKLLKIYLYPKEVIYTIGFINSINFITYSIFIKGNYLHFSKIYKYYLK